MKFEKVNYVSSFYIPVLPGTSNACH